MADGDYLVLRRDRGLLGKWRWQVRARNGKVIDTPGESFFSKGNAKRSAKRVHPDLEIREG